MDNFHTLAIPLARDHALALSFTPSARIVASREASFCGIRKILEEQHPELGSERDWETILSVSMKNAENRLLRTIQS
jgi:hypothetical protein